MTFWLKIAALGALLGLLLGGVLIYGHERFEAGRNAVLVDVAATNGKAAIAAHREIERRLKEDQNAQEATVKAMQRKDAVVAAARTELGRLQEYAADREQRLLEASDAQPTCRADAAAGDGWRLLRACASRYADVASEADTLAARLGGLQRWVSGVCAEPVVAREGDRWDR